MLEKIVGMPFLVLADSRHTSIKTVAVQNETDTTLQIDVVVVFLISTTPTDSALATVINRYHHPACNDKGGTPTGRLQHS